MGAWMLYALAPGVALCCAAMLAEQAALLHPAAVRGESGWVASSSSRPSRQDSCAAAGSALARTSA